MIQANALNLLDKVLKLLKHCFKIAHSLKANKITISIVEENKKLKEWYMKFSFKPVYTKKYDFFPFTCGYFIKMKGAI